jgi:hypothetical protein
MEAWIQWCLDSQNSCRGGGALIFQKQRSPLIRIDLYEVEVHIFFQDEKRVLTLVHDYGEIKEERYVWGKDQYNRPRREKLYLSVVIPRDRVADFKMRVTKLDQATRSRISYRKVSTLV